MRCHIRKILIGHITLTLCQLQDEIPSYICRTKMSQQSCFIVSLNFVGVIIVSQNKAIKPKGRSRKRFVALRGCITLETEISLLRTRKLYESAGRSEYRTKKKKPSRRHRSVKERENPAGSRPTTWVPFPLSPRVATRQITHLARVNNYSETHIIVLHYASISHACVSAGCAFKCCLVTLQLVIVQHLGVSCIPWRKVLLKFETVEIEQN